MQIAGHRFLVVGGAGFIGSHVVDGLLAAGAAHVRIYDNFSRGTRDNLAQALGDARCEIFAAGGDILHRDTLGKAMEGMDGVFHLAALWLLQCQDYPRSAFEVNVAGTMNVIETAIASGIRRLVFSSSASVYGDAIAEPMEEDHPFNCQDLYGASKACGEMLLRALYNRERQKGGDFEYVGLRYMNVYGARQDARGDYVGVVTRMLNALDAGTQPVIHGDGTQAYDFVDVSDCARANILAMQASSTNRHYNIGTGVKTTVAELAERLRLLHPGRTAARFEHSSRPFVRNRVGATRLAAADLGFHASVPLESGLRDFIHWRAAQSKGGESMNANLGVFRSLRVLSGYRHRVLEGVMHDIRQRYIGSVFGSLWAVLFPLLQLSIYAGLYTFIFKVRPSGLTEMGYVVLVFSGLVPLMAFNEALTAATSSLSANKNLLLNTVFPAELIPLRAAIAAQATSLIGLIITLLAGFALGRTSWQAILLVPVFWVLLLMFAMGIGWMFSLLSLVARDVQHGLGLVVMLLFVLSPFAYTPEMVPAALKPVIYMNPLSYYVLSFQQLICYGTWPDPLVAAGAIFLSLGSFFTGFMVFQRAKHVFFDYA